MLVEDIYKAIALLKSSIRMLLEMMFDDGYAIAINKWLCLPKAELKTKNSTKRQLCCRFVEFLVFNSIHWKESDRAGAEHPVFDESYDSVIES